MSATPAPVNLINTGSVLPNVALPVLFQAMSDRAAKVTPEHKREAKKLLELWENRSEKISQAEFGERYHIGTQSAMTKFLHGRVPISKNAAKGFAQGLGCRIEAFSPRLAKEISELATELQSTLSDEVMALAREIQSIPFTDRGRVIELCRDIVRLARAHTSNTPVNDQHPKNSQVKHG